MLGVNLLDRRKNFCQCLQHIDNLLVVVDIVRSQAVGQGILDLEDDFIVPDIELAWRRKECHRKPDNLLVALILQPDVFLVIRRKRLKNGRNQYMVYVALHQAEDIVLGILILMG